MMPTQLATNLPSISGADGVAASLFGGQKGMGQELFDTVLKESMANGAGQTPDTIMLNLFRNVLKEQGSGTVNGLVQSVHSIKSFLDRIEPLIPVMGKLRIPSQAVPSLRALLESLGISSKEASSFIQAASDPQGFVRMDRLWVRLKEKAGSEDSGKDTPTIPLTQAPLVAQMLSAIGMEASQVKALIEKATIGEGGLDSQVIIKAVKAHLADAGVSQIDNAQDSFSRALGMLFTTTESGLLAQEPQLVSLMKSMAQDPSLTQQKRIKQEMGALLQEKGIPPQEVKAFLENFSVAQAKELLKVSQGFEGNGSFGEISTLFSQVKMTTENPNVSKADPQNIMDILFKEDVSKTDSADKKVTSTASNAGAKPASGLANLAEANGTTTTKKADQNAQSGGNTSVLETPTLSNGETLLAGGKFIVVGGAAGLTSAGGSNSAPQVPVEATVRPPVVLPEPLPKILDRMVWMVQEGVQKTTIQLSPPELGRIQLNLVIENGHIHGLMGTESHAVKELIDANLNQLKTQLEAQGFSVQSFDVMVGLNQHQGPGHGSAWQWEPQSGGGTHPEDEVIAAPEEVGGSYDGYSGDGYQISVRV
jgi:flagellar hook-length control protein FliK